MMEFIINMLNTEKTTAIVAGIAIIGTIMAWIILPIIRAGITFIKRRYGKKVIKKQESNVGGWIPVILLGLTFLTWFICGRKSNKI